MSNIDKQALLRAAVKIGAEKWVYIGGGEVLTEEYEVDGLPIADLICECEVVGTSSPKAEFIALANPATVLALLDELEADQRYAKERDEENQDLMLTVGRLRVERETSEAEMGNALCQLLPGCQYMDPPDGGNVTPLEQVRRMVADYRERIAELEAREVVLPNPPVVKYVSGEFIHCWPAYIVDSAIRAAGIITKVGE